MSKLLYIAFALILLQPAISMDAQETVRISDSSSLEIFEEDSVYTLLVAASVGDSAKVLKLLEAGVKADAVSIDGMPALIYAVKNGHAGIVKVLTEKGAKLNYKTPEGNTALLSSVQNGNLIISEYLVRHGADINLSDKKGITPLMYATGIDSFALADMLIYYGADVNKADSNGNTALMVASVTGNYDLVYTLLEYGADANHRDKRGYAPIHAATWYGYWSVMELLLDYGADPLVIAPGGYTPITLAAEADDYEAFKILAYAGADIGQKLGFSENLLTRAVENRNDSIASFLRQNKIRYNYWPNFNQFGLGTEFEWNRNDIMWNFYLASTEMKYNLALWAGGGFRPSANRVLEKYGEDIYYQYYERRGNLFLSLDKSVFLFHGRRWMAGIYGRLKGVYTFGNYRGSDEKPDPGFLFVPGVGAGLENKVVRFTLGYSYHDNDLYKVSPHRISISVGLKWNRGKHSFKPGFINWY